MRYASLINRFSLFLSADFRTSFDTAKPIRISFLGDSSQRTNARSGFFSYLLPREIARENAL